MEIIPVDIIALIEEEQTEAPIVVLHDKKANRILPIWIGEPEARAISLALNKVAMQRPLTHQLVLNIFSQLGYKISRIVVDRMETHTYFATIYVLRGTEEVKIDARPSDSIALALTAGVPIFVAADVMNKAGEANPFCGGVNIAKQSGPRKLELTKDDVGRLTAMLKNAQEREEKSSGA